MTRPSTVASIRGTFRTVAVACIPEAARLSPEEWVRGEQVVDRALAERPPAVRRQLVLFARLFTVLSWIAFGRSPGRAGPERIRGLLHTLERSRFLALRRGVWGLRTLTFMGYYGLPAVRGQIGYRAQAGGWSSREGAQAPWPDRGGAARPEPGTLTAAEADPAAADGRAFDA